MSKWLSYPSEKRVEDLILCIQFILFIKVDSAEEVKADSAEPVAIVKDVPAASDSADSAAAAVAAEETATADGDSAAQTGAASELGNYCWHTMKEDFELETNNLDTLKATLS